MPGDAEGARARYTTITARLLDAAAAEAAIERLQRAGIRPGDSVLIGGASDGDDVDVRWPETDRLLVYSVLRATLVGTWGGAGVCAMLGLVLAALPPVRHAVGAGLNLRTLAIAAVLGAIGGMFGGSLIGMIAGLDRSQAGSDPYDDQLALGATFIGVRSVDAAHTAIACDVLRQCGADDIRVAGPAEALEN